MLRWHFLIALCSLGLAGCNFVTFADPAVTPRDTKYLAMVPKIQPDPNYMRYMIDDPTGEAPGSIVVDSKQNFCIL